VVSSDPIRAEIQMFNLLPDNPSSHRIDIESKHIATDAVSLDQRYAATHKRVGNDATREIVCVKEAVRKRLFAELGQQQSPEQRAGPSREPFVDGDNRSVVLLNLLFLERHTSDHGNVESGLDSHL